MSLEYPNSRSSLLFIEVWKIRCWICQHIKKSRFKLDQITKDLMPDLVIVLWRSNFKSIPSLEEHWCRYSCCSCPVADTNQSSGDSGCTLRTIVLFQRSPKNKHPMPSNQFELAVALFFQSSAMLGVIKSSFEQHLKFFSLPASDDLQMLLMTSASGDQLLRRVLLMALASSGPLVFRTSFL